MSKENFKKSVRVDKENKTLKGKVEKVRDSGWDKKYEKNE